jgi:hypothetical protein
LPVSPGTGDLYLFTDSVYTIARCDSSPTWSIFRGGRLAVPPGPKSGWTNINAGSDMTVTDAAGSINIGIVRNASLNWRLITKTLAASYTVTAYMTAQMLRDTAQTVGVYFYDGTKLMGLEFLAPSASGSGPFTMRAQRMNSVTSASTTPYSLNNFEAGPAQGGMYLRITNDGANLTLFWSLDGIVYTQAYTEAVGAFLTPTGYGFGGVNLTSNAGDPMTISLQSVVVT